MSWFVPPTFNNCDVLHVRSIPRLRPFPPASEKRVESGYEATCDGVDLKCKVVQQCTVYSFLHRSSRFSPMKQRYINL